MYSTIMIFAWVRDVAWINFIMEISKIINWNWLRFLMIGEKKKLVKRDLMKRVQGIRENKIDLLHGTKAEESS